MTKPHAWACEPCKCVWEDRGTGFCPKCDGVLLPRPIGKMEETIEQLNKANADLTHSMKQLGVRVTCLEARMVPAYNDDSELEPPEPSPADKAMRFMDQHAVSLICDADRVWHCYHGPYHCTSLNPLTAINELMGNLQNVRLA